MAKPASSSSKKTTPASDSESAQAKSTPSTAKTKNADSTEKAKKTAKTGVPTTPPPKPPKTPKKSKNSPPQDGDTHAKKTPPIDDDGIPPILDPAIEVEETDDTPIEPQDQEALDKITESEARQAYQLMRAKLDALSPKRVVVPNFPVTGIVALTLRVARHSQEDSKRLQALANIGEISHDALQDLRPLALTLWFLELRWQNSRTQSQAKTQSPHIVEATELRRELLQAAAYLWRKDNDIKKILASIRQGTGLQDAIEDLQRLSQLFTKHWSDVKGRSDIKKDHIRRADELSILSLDFLLEENQRSALDARNRAYSLLAQHYNEIVAAGRFLYHKDREISTKRYPQMARHNIPTSAKKPSTKKQPAPPPQDPPSPQPTSDPS